MTQKSTAVHTEMSIAKNGKNHEISCGYGAATKFNFDNIVGNSEEFMKAVALGKRFAHSSASILLTGESGTGKEVFAQAIHHLSSPYDPFIALNVAAMPSSLIESELFGYVGGSFTGADRTGRPGKIELANGGTLFLDEIGDMPLEFQAILLRVLEDKQVMRIGGNLYKKIRFRLITATNKDLYQMVQQNLFREDLYYRLAVLPISLPPLRNRGNDIELLSNYFILQHCDKACSSIPQISPSAMKIIKSYSWPGNVRELENAIIYALNICHDNIIQPYDLPTFIINPNVGDPKTKLKDIEKSAIKKTLNQTRNNIPKAAELLGVSKTTLYRKVRLYKINCYT